MKETDTRVQFTAGYGGKVKISVTIAGETHVMEEQEAERIIAGTLAAGYRTDLQPRQQYKRIYATD